MRAHVKTHIFAGVELYQEAHKWMVDRLQRALVGTTYIMEYILALSEVALGTSGQALTFSQIHAAIQRKAANIQKTKMMRSGKKWSSYDKLDRSPRFMRVGATKLIRAMIRWNLLRKRDEYYVPTKELLKIGNSVLKGAETEYKRLILECMFRNDPELAFAPSRYLVPIRDYVLPARFSAGLGNIPSEETCPRVAAIVKGLLGVNMVDFDMMSAWGQFFNFTGTFDPKIVGQDTEKQVFLTCWLASLAELFNTYETLVAKERSPLQYPKDATYVAERSLTHCIALLREVHWIDVHNGVVELAAPILQRTVLEIAEKLTEAGGVVISEGARVRRIEVGEDLDLSRVFAILPRKAITHEFDTSLIKQYRFLKQRFGTPNAWISQLRALCCKELGIQGKTFDSALTESYRKLPERFEFSMIGGDVTRRKIRTFGKPFRLYNQLFRMVRLEEKHFG